MTLTAAHAKLMSREYHDISKSGSYQSPGKFYLSFEACHPKSKVTLNNVREWMKQEDTYTLNKEYRGKFAKPNIVVAGLNDTWEADLADLSKYSKSNNGYKYLLGVIDVFSRKLYLRPIINKYAQTVIDAFAEILTEAGSKCNKLRSDMGNEFTNDLFQNFLRSKGIGHYFSHGTAQCAYIERVWKTIKKRIVKFMFETKSKRYIDNIEGIVSSYSNTVHSITGLPPNEITLQNESDVIYTEYLARCKREGGVKSTPKKVRYRFKVNDIVRIAKRKEKIGGEYKEKWSREKYKVYKRSKTYGVPLYNIMDADGDIIAGSFYERELQEVSEDEEDKLYEIDRVLKVRVNKGVKEGLVSWRGYDKKFNTWIPMTQIQDI